jgi:hypothetical protein
VNEELLKLARRRYEVYDAMWNRPSNAERESDFKMTFAAVACADLIPALLAEIDRLAGAASGRSEESIP